MILSHHAQTRCQQRAIRDAVIDLLWDYGEVGHHRGADIFYMSRRSRESARRDLGRRVFAHMEARLNSYLVVSRQGILITAGRRKTRLKF